MNIENNKIIAEFLGWTLDDEELNTYRKKISVIFHYRKFNFQTDWNDLMEVVEKIQSVCEEPEQIDNIKDDLWWGNKESVYLSCFEFIEYYNKEK